MGIFHNEIGNNLIVQDNTGPYVRIRFNHVGFTAGGGINFQDNTSQGYMWRNDVGNSINCTGNTLTPGGHWNVAGSGLMTSAPAWAEHRLTAPPDTTRSRPH